MFIIGCGVLIFKILVVYYYYLNVGVIKNKYNKCIAYLLLVLVL